MLHQPIRAQHSEAQSGSSEQITAETHRSHVMNSTSSGSSICSRMFLDKQIPKSKHKSPVLNTRESVESSAETETGDI